MQNNSNKPINVTQPSVPPLEEYHEFLKQIWNAKVLTNNGSFHKQFERALAEYLGVKHISVFSNGTLALITALRALEITGEVITTPFSFVATTHSLWWNNIKPVFSDIEPNFFNLDPEKIETAITPQTTAIMPVHVYGNPCNVKKLKEIADTYGLKLIYDAAHAFGVKINGQSLLDFGDLSILSFHATKVFNTIEGGAIVSPDEKTKKRIDQLKNFGFIGETTVTEPGINAKMNELQAAYGLLQLKYIDENISKRKNISTFYRSALNQIPGIRCFEDIPGVELSYSYFPVLINKDIFGKSRDDVYEELKKNNIFTRRYFYPLISQFPMYCNLDSALPGKMPIAEQITEEVLCLPLYSHLEIDNVEKIINLVRAQKK